MHAMHGTLITPLRDADIGRLVFRLDESSVRQSFSEEPMHLNGPRMDAYLDYSV